MSDHSIPAAMRRLLPPGRAFGTGGFLGSLLEALSQEFTRLRDSAKAFHEGILPTAPPVVLAPGGYESSVTLLVQRPDNADVSAYYTPTIVYTPEGQIDFEASTWRMAYITGSAYPFRITSFDTPLSHQVNLELYAPQADPSWARGPGYITVSIPGVDPLYYRGPGDQDPFLASPGIVVYESAQPVPVDPPDTLEEWERELSLASTGAVDVRVERVRSRLRGDVGHSLAAVSADLAAVGWTVVDVERTAPLVAGSAAGEPLSGDPWAHHVVLRATEGSNAVTLEEARAIARKRARSFSVLDVELAV